MSKQTHKRPVQPTLPIQLEVFQYSKNLNLSETYETIPKEISNRDPKIKWVNENMAKPVERVFTLNDKTYVSAVCR